MRPLLARRYVDAGKRERCAAAVAELAHEIGPERLTTTGIIKRARVGRHTFYELFSGVAASLEFACEWAGLRLSAPVRAAAQEPALWGERVERAIVALLDTVEEQECAAELYLIHRPGLVAEPMHPNAVVVALMEVLAPAPTRHQVPAELAELVSGGIVAVIADRLRSSGTDSLPALREGLVQLALTAYGHASEASQPLQAVESACRADRLLT